MKTRQRPAATKSEHKTLRLSARAKFATSFWSAIDGQSGNKYVELAIENRADALTKERKISWRTFWHPIEGVRWLKLFLFEDFPLDEADDLRRVFVQEHMPFFYDVEDADRPEPIVRNAETLWPRIDEFMALAGKNYWDAGRAMIEALRARGIDAPSWPQVAMKVHLEDQR